MTITYEIHIYNMDGKFEIREYKDLNEAQKVCNTYGGIIYKVTREEIK